MLSILKTRVILSDAKSCPEERSDVGIAFAPRLVNCLDGERSLGRFAPALRMTCQGLVVRLPHDDMLRRALLILTLLTAAAPLRRTRNAAAIRRRPRRSRRATPSSRSAFRCATASSCSRRSTCRATRRADHPILMDRTPYGVAPYGADAYRTSLGPERQSEVRRRRTSSSSIRTRAGATSPRAPTPR